MDKDGRLQNQNSDVDGCRWTRTGEVEKEVPTMKSLDGVNKKNDVNNTASEAPGKNVKTESEKIDFSNFSLYTGIGKAWLSCGSSKLAFLKYDQYLTTGSQYCDCFIVMLS